MTPKIQCRRPHNAGVDVAAVMQRQMSAIAAARGGFEPGAIAAGLRAAFQAAKRGPNVR